MSVDVAGGPLDPALQELVLGRLCGPSAPDAAVADLVFAACEGAAELEALLGEGAASNRPTVAPVKPSGPIPEPPGAFLTSITVEGFRGVGPSTTLPLTPGPGLTLVVGRNGSGKSSFAEAAEVVVAGSTARLSKERSADWRNGWRNLSHPHARVEVGMFVDGKAKAPG